MSALAAELADAGLDPTRLRAQIADALAEDLPPDGTGVDVTSEATLPDVRVTAEFGAREDGVVAGLGIAAFVFEYVLGSDVEITDRVPDGSRVTAGDVVMRVSGPVKGILIAERTALNFASHLSGVATATAAWVDALAGTGARVLDTRKTLPGYRAMQKYAVRCGGGVNHRFSLSDMALVKDNHVVAAGGVLPAYRAVKARFPDLPVEVEVTDTEQLRELLAVGCERVLLDNMDDAAMAEAVALRDASGSSTVLEASGGLTLERARQVALTGVDFISVGALTHSVNVFDLGLDLPEGR
ncbi:MAG: carboxylating nicotinate-nucleotide diphosphorylase [Propionibacteriales bacterium]|nr:carboxylating nicotinate-nucleotide diphosphorylase [Propionibacteriales bacterium]